MKHITFSLDFRSPLAYQMFEELPTALMGYSYSVTYQPVALPDAVEPVSPLNRYRTESRFKQLWPEGVPAADPLALEGSGAPSFAVDGQLFQGPDALSRLQAYVASAVLPQH